MTTCKPRGRSKLPMYHNFEHQPRPLTPPGAEKGFDVSRTDSHTLDMFRYLAVGNQSKINTNAFRTGAEAGH